MTTLTPQLPANEARSNFYKILEDVDKTMSHYTITHRGRDKAVIMSVQEFESWQETLEIMANPQLVKDIKQGMKELKEGKGLSEEEVDKILGWNKK